MRCSIAQSKIPAALDGDLAPGERHLLMAHVGECAACANEFEASQDLDALLNEVVLCPAPNYSFAQLRERLTDIDTLDEIRAWLPKLRARGPVARLAASCLMVLLMVMGQGSMRVARTVHQNSAEGIHNSHTRLDLTMRMVESGQVTDVLLDELNPNVRS